MQKKIGQDLRTLVHGIVDALKIKSGKFLRSEGVHIGAQRIHLFDDVKGGALFRPFEEHVLGKMGDAAIGLKLVPAADLDENAEGNGMDIRNILICQADAVWQSYDLIHTTIIHN